MEVESITGISIPALDLAYYCKSKNVPANHKRYFLTTPRFLYVSENAILHSSGNYLQISNLPNAKDITNPDLNSIAAGNIEYSDNNFSKSQECCHQFAFAELGRGFTCFVFNSHRNQVAYSPRETFASIFVKSLKDDEQICRIDQGESVGYSDISFNRDGSKIAAIERGGISPKLFVWDLINDRNNETKILYIASLSTVFSLKKEVLICKFNPMNDKQIAILQLNGKKIIVCELHVSFGETQVKELNLDWNLHSADSKKGKIDKFKDNLGSIITTFSWETNNSLLYGTSDGSLILLDILTGKTWALYQTNTEELLGEVIQIIVTNYFYIVGFRKGFIMWFDRIEGNSSAKVSNLNISFKASTCSDICQISCSPNFERVIVLDVSGNVNLYSVDASKNEEHENTDGLSQREKSQTKKTGPLAQIHEGLISDMATIILTGKSLMSLLVSGGFNGCVTAFRESEICSSSHIFSNPVCSIDLGSPITAFESLDGYPILSVGSADGYVRFLHFGRDPTFLDRNVGIQISIIAEERVCSRAVTALEFSTEVKKVVAACYESQQAFVFCTEPNNLHIIGVVQTSDKCALACVAWCTKNPSHVIVASIAGCISCFDTTPMCFTSKPVFPLWKCQFADVYNLNQMVITSSTNQSRAYVISSNIRGISCFNLSEIEKQKNYTINSCAHLSLKGVAKEEKKIILNKKLGIVVTGSTAGDITFYSLNNGDCLRPQHTKRLHCTPITSIVFSANGSHLYTSSANGSLMVHKTKNNKYPLPPSAYEYDYLLPTHSEIEENTPCQRRLRNHFQDQDVVESKQDREEIIVKVKQLKERIMEMTKHNDSLHHLEKLSQEDCIIDRTRNNNKKSELQKYLESLLHTNTTKTEDELMIAVRIKEKYWDTMKDHLSILSEVSSSPTCLVPNIPVRKLSKKEERTISIVKTLRMNEIVDIQRRKNKSSRNGLCWLNFLNNNALKVNFVFDIANYDYHQNLDGMDTTSTFSRRNAHQERQDVDTEINFSRATESKFSTCSLLYPPLSIRSEGQRRSQLILLQQHGREISILYNKKFAKVRKEKVFIKKKIKITTDKLYDILEELYPDQTVIHKCSIDIKNECDDILCFDERKSDTSMMTNKDSGENKDIDSYLRGLQEMMYGTLEVKMTQMMLQYNGEKASWMNKLKKNEMTCKQIKEFEIYKQKENEWKNQIEKRRQNLSSESKKLSSEIADVAATFNEKVHNLYKEGLLVKESLTKSEVYISYLLREIYQNESNQRIIMEITSKTEQQKSVLKDMLKDHEVLKERYESVRIVFIDKTSQSNLLIKSFRKNIQEASTKILDQESVKLLHQFFLKQDIRPSPKSEEQTRKVKKSNKVQSKVSFKRISRRSKLGRQSGRESLVSFEGELNTRSSIGSYRKSNGSKVSNDDLSTTVFGQIVLEVEKIEEKHFLQPNDPFVPKSDTVDNTCSTKSTPSSDLLSMNEIPEGFEISENVWEAMQNFRLNRIGKEEELVDASFALQELKTLKENSHKAIEKILDNIQTLEKSRLNLQYTIERMILCPTFMASVQQGQDEIEHLSQIASDYTESLFIPSDVIEEINKSIQSLGNERIKIILRSKNFQKILNVKKWNDKLLKQKLYHTKESYTDYQYLRMTGEVKKIVAGTEKTSAKEIDKLFKAKEELTRQGIVHGKKKKKLLRDEKHTQTCIRERHLENSHLQEKLQNLREIVRIKNEKLELLNRPNIEGLKIKRIMKQRKVKNMIEKNKNEIRMLRSSLDKYQQRTFPSFPAVC